MDGITIFLLVMLGLLCFAAVALTVIGGRNGIVNFGQVNEFLYRGAQPDEAGIRYLKSIGVKTIINLRMPSEALPTEAAMAESHGIVYTNIPFTGNDRPTDVEIAKVLSIISNSGPVFVHCAHGCDRTGAVIACYRIQRDDWSMDAALAEAEKYGLSRTMWSLRRYIADFAKASRKEPETVRGEGVIAVALS